MKAFEALDPMALERVFADFYALQKDFGEARAIAITGKHGPQTAER